MLKELGSNYISKWKAISAICLDKAKCVDFRGKNSGVDRTQGVCHVIHHCRIYVVHFREGFFLLPLHP